MSEKRIVVIGAGFGGMSAAAVLAKNGNEVTLVEKNSQPGGRAMLYKKEGFIFDMGPSWYLMPEAFERYFAQFGKKPTDYFELKRLDPSYRVFFGTEKVVDVPTELEKSLTLFDELENDGSRKLSEYLQIAERNYRIAMDKFIYRDYTSIFNFFNRQLILEGLKLNIFSSLERYNKRFFESDKSRKILEYTTVFLGGAPSHTPALYSIMAHVDLNLGVWYPVPGGIGAVVDAVYSTARDQGVEFKFNQNVSRIQIEGKHAKAVETDQEVIDADIIVANADYHHVDTKLLEPKYRSYSQKYWRKRVMAPSAFLIYLGVDKELDGILHHNLYLDPKWDAHFDSIFDQPGWPESPSYYVSATSKTDASIAPPGKECLFFLVPVAPGLNDTDKVREKYFTKIITHFEKLIGQTIKDSIIVKKIFSHRDFTDSYNAYKGTALGLAHTLRQTAVFRPAHRSKKVKNLYFTGHYTHPGVGVPMVLISSEIINEIISKEQYK